MALVSEVSPVGDVDDVARLFSAYRLQVGRQARGLTRTQLAEAVKVSAAAVSQFELGHAKPSAGTVARLAERLDLPVTFFSSASLMADPGQGDEVVDSFGHFRSLRSLTATRRRQALTVAHLLADVTAYLDVHVRLPQPSVPAFRADDIDVVPKLAAQVRREFSVPQEGPVESVLRLLERHGVVTARYPFDAADVSAFSVPATRRAFLVLKRHRQARLDRDRFSACHELAHLVLHEPGQVLASKDVEAQANAFAAAFLMPADSIVDQLPSKLDWPALLALKSKWGVSMAALLMRARDLQVMSQATYVQGMRTMSTRGWRQQEPGSVAVVEAPAMLERALRVAGLGPADVSAATGWPVEMVAELIAESVDARPAVNL